MKLMCLFLKINNEKNDGTDILVRQWTHINASMFNIFNGLLKQELTDVFHEMKGGSDYIDMDVT